MALMMTIPTAPTGTPHAISVFARYRPRSFISGEERKTKAPENMAFPAAVAEARAAVAVDIKVSGLVDAIPSARAGEPDSKAAATAAAAIPEHAVFV